MLPRDPLLGDRVIVRVDGEAELVLRVVVARQVEEDGETLEDGEVMAVVVDNGGDAAIGVDGDEPRLLLGVLGDVDGLERELGAVGLLELLQEDADLDAVGGSCKSESALHPRLFQVVSPAARGWGTRADLAQALRSRAVLLCVPSGVIYVHCGEIELPSGCLKLRYCICGLWSPHYRCRGAGVCDTVSGNIWQGGKRG